MSKSILALGASELAQVISRREVSSVEATRALLGRLDTLQAEIHPMALLWRDEALRMAEASDARRANHEPLSSVDGLPLTLKENLDVKGHETTLGVEAKRGHPCKQDAVVVKLLRRAGCVFLGKSNVSQFLLFHECSNPVFGRTNNPYGADRSPGGSSGGEAAAVAAYGSPGGFGTDIGGSVRVPAHFCGVATLKPTVDRVSYIGIQGALPGQEIVRGQVGPIGRNVDDLVTLLQLISPESCAEFDPRVPPFPIGDPKNVDLSRVRVGFFLEDGIVKPSLAVRRAVQEAVEALREAGAIVLPFSPPSCEELILTYLATLSSDGGKTVDAQLAGGTLDPNLRVLMTMAKLPATVKRAAAFGLDLKREPFLPKMLRSMGEKPVAELWRLTAVARRIQAKVFAAWKDADLDAVVCPPHATVALPHGACKDFTLGASLSMRYNFLNFPAGVVPVTRVHADETVRDNPRGRLEKRAAEVDRGSEGLPVGVQVVARPFREDVALALMKAIESRVSGRPEYPRLEVPES